MLTKNLRFVSIIPKIDMYRYDIVFKNGIMLKALLKINKNVDI
jgi:hypothetical protein